MTTDAWARSDKPSLPDEAGIDFGGDAPSKPDFCVHCMSHIRKHNKLPPWAWKFLKVPVVPNCMRRLNRIERSLLATKAVSMSRYLLESGLQTASTGRQVTSILAEPRAFELLGDKLRFGQLQTSVVQHESAGSDVGYATVSDEYLRAALTWCKQWRVQILRYQRPTASFAWTKVHPARNEHRPCRWPCRLV